MQASVFKAGVVTVSSSTPTAINPGFKPKVGIQIKGKTGNSGIVYIGGSDVNTTDGYPLSAGESIFLPFDQNDILFALAATNNDKIHYLAY